MSEADRAAAAAWLGAGMPAVVVEVRAVQGSAPREAGTRMLVSADATLGTIGGGHLELEAITAARALLARGDATRDERRYALGPTLGQCCGGAVVLGWQRLTPAVLATWPEAAPLFRLQLHGAGHVGRAVATLLATLPCDVDWFDERDDGFPARTTLGSPWPAHIRRHAGDTVEAEVARAPAGSLFLVMTHEHALDLRLVEAIMRRGDFAWCGVIGSATKRARFASRLRQRGHADETIARMTCPIGLAAITGKQPAVIAASVVAQLLTVRSAVVSRSALLSSLTEPTSGERWRSRRDAGVGAADGHGRDPAGE